MAAARQGGTVWHTLSMFCLDNSGSGHRDAQHTQRSVGLGSGGGGEGD